MYSNEYQIFQRIIKLEYSFPSGFPDVPKDLVEKLLVSSGLQIYTSFEDNIKLLLVFNTSGHKPSSFVIK